MLVLVEGCSDANLTFGLMRCAIAHVAAPTLPAEAAGAVAILSRSKEAAQSNPWFDRLTTGLVGASPKRRRSPELVEGRAVDALPWFDRLTTGLRLG
jgi:hypothetical protein